MSNLFTALKDLPNLHFTHVFYRWNLISDADDNKFVDCYVASGAKYLITQDAHFSILKGLTFPEVNVVTILEFEVILKSI